MSDKPEPLSAMNGTDAVLGMEYNGAEGHESDTVASIIAEMRDTWTDTPPSALLDLADRIEAAAERDAVNERDRLRDIVWRTVETLEQVYKHADMTDYLRAEVVEMQREARAASGEDKE